MTFPLTSAFHRDYAFPAAKKQRSRLASRKLGGQPPLSGFFTSVIQDTHFYGWIVWGVERLAGP
jgi:hypothetical protein